MSPADKPGSASGVALSGLGSFFAIRILGADAPSSTMSPLRGCEDGPIAQLMTGRPIPTRRAGFDGAHLSTPRRGINKSAQGIALGLMPAIAQVRAPTGRNNHALPGRTGHRMIGSRGASIVTPFQGRRWNDPRNPGRCPGLICRAPSGQAHKCATSKRAGEGSVATLALPAHFVQYNTPRPPNAKDVTCTRICCAPLAPARPSFHLTDRR